MSRPESAPRPVDRVRCPATAVRRGSSFDLASDRLKDDAQFVKEVVSLDELDDAEIGRVVRASSERVQRTLGRVDAS